MYLKILAGPILALLLTSGLIIWLIPLARSAGFVDLPDARKKHTGAVPLIGGPAIFVAVFAAMAASGLAMDKALEWTNFGTFYLAGMILVLAGAVDDHLCLKPIHKLAIQTLAALIMIFGAGVVVRDLGALGPSGTLLELGAFAVPVTLLVTLAAINAVNMSDGLDGLAGSYVLVCLLGFSAATLLFGNGDGMGLLAILAAAVAGFLLFNHRFPWQRRAVVFLGDSGSMFLGFALAWFAIRFTQGDDRVLSPSAVLWFLILPLFDTFTMMMRRILKKRPPFGADREHLHHIFLLAGFTVSETSLILSSIAAAGVLVGLGGTYLQVPDYLMLGGFLFLCMAYFWMIMHSWSVLRFLRFSINRRMGTRDRRMMPDRRMHTNVAHFGPERRSGKDRRKNYRRSEDLTSLEEGEEAEERKVSNS